MFYHYNCETINGDTCEIVVMANNKSESIDKLKTYRVNRGELKYYHLVSITKNGEEKFYNPKNNGTILVVAMMGSALGMCQVSQYGITTDYKKGLTEETIKIIKNNADIY